MGSYGHIVLSLFGFYLRENHGIPTGNDRGIREFVHHRVLSERLNYPVFVTVGDCRKPIVY